MGIPRFFKWIGEKFPDTIKRTSFSTGEIVTPDCLYLDANGIIHNCVRKVYFPDSKRMVGGGGKSKTKNLEKQAFSSIFEYIVKIYDLVSPKKLIYISIDGTAPIAKQAQQRQRRYKSAEDKSSEEFETFDTNSITPGTDFLKRLEKFMAKSFKEKDWNCEIIFSDSGKPGEGEHKLLYHIRKNRVATHMVYGLDADLFMLTLSTGCSSIYLLREDIFCLDSFDTYFHVVNVSEISKGLYSKYKHFYSKISKQRFIDDFIFICFLVGNDFLHNIPSLYDLENSIDMMLEIPREQIVDFRGEFGINLMNLKDFLSKISEKEDELLSSQLGTRRFENKVLNKAMKSKFDPKQGIDLNIFRKEYYKKAGVESNEDVMKFCRRYIQGLGWVNWYYHKKCINWRWLFPYHYSPLLTDLVLFLDNLDTSLKPMHLVRAGPLTQEQQLMCVIPPKSKMLLPESLQKLYKHDKLIDYYPETFERDLAGKLRDWEAIAILPFIDLKVLLEIMKEN